MRAAAWLALPFILAGVAYAAAPARIALKSEAVVTERQVRLGAIATIESSDLATVERLVAMPVAMAPRPGYTDRLTREEIKRRLRTVTPGIRSPLAWEGADAVRIELGTSLVEGERLRAMAVEHARAAFEPRFAGLDVAAVENVADVAVPPGALTLRPRVLPADALARRMPVWIDVFVDNVFFRAVAVAVQVEAFAPALVGARAARRGTRGEGGRFRSAPRRSRGARPRRDRCRCAARRPAPQAAAARQRRAARRGPAGAPGGGARHARHPAGEDPYRASRSARDRARGRIRR
jgi:hypothetical protein